MHSLISSGPPYSSPLYRRVCFGFVGSWAWVGVGGLPKIAFLLGVCTGGGFIQDWLGIILGGTGVVAGLVGVGNCWVLE